jgi:cytoplasmic iron level regulating protein YaaA (DUF328/UPF0246 family)
VNEQHQEEYNNLQREIRMESEIKEKAKKLRIQNFYKSKNGKLNSTSFYSVKEKGYAPYFYGSILLRNV